MSDFITPVYKAIANIVVAVCPEVANDATGVKRMAGVWNAEHASKIPWETFAPPYAVTLVQSWMKDTEKSVVCDVYRAPVMLFYVDSFNGNTKPIYTKLLAIRKALIEGDPRILQVDDISSVSVGDDLLPNQILTEKNVNHRAGCISFMVWCGEPIGNPS